MQISGMGGFNPADMFRKADKDGNNGLDLSEFKELGKNAPAAGAPALNNTEEVFKKIDADGDGLLTQTELDNARPPQLSPETAGSLLDVQSSSESSLLDILFNSDGDTTGDQLTNILQKYLALYEENQARSDTQARTSVQA